MNLSNTLLIFLTIYALVQQREDYMTQIKNCLKRDLKRFWVLEKVVILKPYSISILSMIPQFVLMTAGEILFSVTGLEFSYSQAPKSMKSIIQACWLLTVAIGNLIVVIITKINLFSNPVDEIYFYCLLMFLDMIIFMIFAYNYKYKEEIDDDSLLVRSRGIPMKRMQNSNASPIVIAPDCYE